MEREEGIKIIAYRIWEEENCNDGRAIEHWLKAETIWQEQNKPVSIVVAEVRDQQINTTSKTKPATALSTQLSKKIQSSKRKP